MKKLVSDRIVDGLAESGAIVSEDKELYSYGLRQGMLIVLNLATVIIIGLVFEMIWQSMAFMLAYIPLRSYAGGYHAKTQFKCYLFSTMLIVGVLLGMKLIHVSDYIWIGFLLFSGGLIYSWAPVEADNKPLEEIENIVYKLRARKILLIELILCIFLKVFNYLHIFKSIVMAIVVLSIMLIIEKIRRHKIKEK